MDFPVIAYYLGIVLKIESFAMIPACILSFVNQEESAIPFLMVIAFCFLSGLLLSQKKWKNRTVYMKEGAAITGLSWILLPAIGAVPFVLSGAVSSYINALFEMVSGFTTTGASVIPKPEELGFGLLFWRSASHWLGGMGVLVLLLAIVPQENGSSMNLMKLESPGPQVTKLVPKISDTSKRLYLIYLGLTAICILSYWISGMDLFDAFTIGMGTAGTGGFAVTSIGMGAYSNASQALISFWMIVFGVNFTLYYLILKGKIKEAFRSEELRWYLIFILLVAAAFTVAIRITNPGEGFYYAMHNGIFTVGSLISSTGFGTVDYSIWPSFAKILVFFTMFVGAMAGSTGGGFKMSRFIILLKEGREELRLLIHPNSVRQITMDHKMIKPEVRHSVLRYFIFFSFTLGLSVFLLSFDPIDYGFETNAYSVLACLNNIGPGIGLTGPAGNFAGFSVFSKIVLIMNMIMGRLELIPILMLLNPRTWKKHF